MKVFIFTTFLFFCLLFINVVQIKAVSLYNQNNFKTEPQTVKDADENVLYTGKIYHIFFHSLIVYPKLAFDGTKMSHGYEDWMITRDEFQKILPELYKNNFVLIDIASLYEVNKENGEVIKKPIYLPAGKKPLIISLDDLAYYATLVGHGFARKLVFDKDGNIATEIVTTSGKVEITRDGDVVPILDDFISTHPDFSFKGAKGIIALTGYHGVLGYRTDDINSPNYSNEIEGAKKIISKLKSTGWRFASHSYSHDKDFSNGSISLERVKKDTESWNKEVKPLVGDTDIFIGPYGTIFKLKDARRKYLISEGFKMFCSVGMDLYFRYNTDSITMDRADIDGYRLVRTPHYLKDYFDYKSVIDPLRSKE